MIKAIAIDDESPALKIIEAFCAKTDEINLLKTFTQPLEALRYIKKYPVDLLFLDINMPSISGIDFCKSVEKSKMIIFTTAYSDYAVEGFDLNAVDYLLKPFTYERFIQSTNKALEYYHFQKNTKDITKQHLFIRADYSLIKVDMNDILYIEGLDDYLKIVLQSRKPIVARMTMKNILDLLPENIFCRVHRSYIVSLANISSVRSKVIQIGGFKIPIGASYELAFNQNYKD